MTKKENDENRQLIPWEINKIDKALARLTKKNMTQITKIGIKEGPSL